MHNHSSATSDGNSAEQSVALLAYMVEHNKSHARELHDVAHEISEEAADLIHEAVALYEKENEKLSQALEILKKGE